MKQVFPDLVSMTSARYIYDLARLRKLKRYWGTTTIAGTEVFVKKKVFYPSMDESTEKLAKFLNMYDDLRGKQEGVESAWLYLNPEKATDFPSGTSATLIGKNLQLALKKLVEGDKTVRITLGAKVEKIGSTTTLTPPTFLAGIEDQPALKTEILTRLFSLYSEGFSVEVAEDDPYVTALAVYGLVLAPTACTLDSVGPTLTVHDYVDYLYTGEEFIRTEVATAYALSIKFQNIAIDGSSDISSAVRGAILSPSTSTDKLVKSRISGFSLAEYSYHDVRVPPSDFWLAHQVGSYDVEDVAFGTQTGNYSVSVVRRPVIEYYLKTSLFDDTSFKREERIRYFLDSIDSDYKKKKLEWYETLAVIVIIVAAVILAIPSGGASFASAWAAAAYFATIITVAALYVAIATYALAVMGAYNVAAATGQFLKAVDPLVKIAGLYLIVYSITKKAVEDAARREAENQLKGQAVERTLTDIVIDYGKATVEQVTGVTDLSDMSTEHTLKMLNFSFDIYKDWQTRDLHDEIRNYRSELSELQQAQEHAQTSDIVKEIAQSYPNLIAKDNSIYAERYDRPYEWWSTPYHTGNIQATTVNALWLS